MIVVVNVVHIHSRPQSPSFLGHVVGKRGVGYKLSRVALGTRMGTHRIRKPPFCPATSKREASVFRNPHSGERFLGIRVDGS